MWVDSGDGLPVSAVPGSDHNTTVSRTSVRPKVCNQATGRCKGGGLESPPTNKLHMSTPEERNVLPKSHETRGLQPGQRSKVIIGDFNAKVGPRRTPEELHIGLQWNDQGERLSEFITTTKTTRGNSEFRKPSSPRWTWESPGGGYRNEIDYIIVNKRFCLTDVAVMPKFYTGTIINWDLFATLHGIRDDSVMDNIDEEYDRLVEHLHD
ncbi:hypothetical protein RB195_023229 [Necator americanus]|uniref:Endonuclease/exonuclease/phosphatase domain-containing protein n=1 Tax=Necator americanus TaxID=51031 RepID=A0ABR1EII4_NECAM